MPCSIAACHSLVAQPAGPLLLFYLPILQSVSFVIARRGHVTHARPADLRIPETLRCVVVKIGSVDEGAAAGKAAGGAARRLAAGAAQVAGQEAAPRWQGQMRRRGGGQGGAGALCLVA